MPRPASRAKWLLPVLFLGGVAIALFGVLYAIDRHLAGPEASASFFRFKPERITDALASLSSMFAAVLGLIVTVVSIVVQLSAERYTQVTRMFFGDRTNQAVLAFYVVGCMCGIFVSFSLGDEFVPRVAVVAMLAFAVTGFALMAPYFAYVFDFLQPENIIRRIRTSALAVAASGARTADETRRDRAQAATLAAMEQLTDITINSISSKDKIIATAGVDALKELAVRYLALKPEASAAWFAVGTRLRDNPDFVSLSPESAEGLSEARTWVEWKVLRQYQAIYGEALATMRDINYVIAIDTRYVGEAAIAAGDREALALCVKFFNSYVRATLNARDVRTAYNILNQYRQLTEALLRAGWSDKAVEVVGYLKYYGHVSYQMKLAFITETVAYDLCAVCEVAHELRSPVERQILKGFLDVDQAHTEGDVQEASLRGVRKAQVKLATFYLVRDAQALARLIFDDMHHERPERLHSIREELERVQSKDFWEVVDRGANFDYLPPERKAALATFFGWFGPGPGLHEGRPRAAEG